LAEVRRQEQLQKCSYNEAFESVSANPRFKADCSNQFDDNTSADLKEASNRRMRLQAAVREMMRKLPQLTYDEAFSAALKADPTLANAMKQPAKPDAQSFRQFNYAGPTLLERSPSEYGTWKGFRNPAVPLGTGEALTLPPKARGMGRM